MKNMVEQDYIINVKAKIEDVISGIDKTQKELGKLNLGENFRRQAEGAARAAVQGLTKQMSKLDGANSASQIEAIKKRVNEIVGQYQLLGREFTNKNFKAEDVFIPSEAYNKIENRIKTIRESIKNLKKEIGTGDIGNKGLQEAAKGGQAELTKERDKQLRAATNKITTNNYKALKETKEAQGVSESKIVSTNEKQIKSLEKENERIQEQIRLLNELQNLQRDSKGNINTEAYQKKVESYNLGASNDMKIDPKANLGQLGSATTKLNASVRSNNKEINRLNAENNIVIAYNNQEAALRRINDIYESILLKAKQISNLTGQETKAKGELGGIRTEEIAQAQQQLNNISPTIDDVNNKANDASDAFDQYGTAMERAAEKSKTLGQIKSYLTYFFSVQGIISTVRRVVTGAINDFKELDKELNAISIVTGKSMNELWGNFTQLNETAQQYGVTTSNVVQVQKLFYQQGRTTAEVTQLTAEALKFAKISGLDYADATDKLTAALNAYNIEAKNAAQITDTYAALSSNAAASSEEIAVAMSKVASLAASAGSTLNDTSAYLTKIIETTREGAETAGTALTYKFSA